MSKLEEILLITLAHVGPWTVAALAAAYAADRLLQAAEELWRRQRDKFYEAELLMRAERYKALGVDCNRNCYMHGCRYERITETLTELGVKERHLADLVEYLNGADSCNSVESVLEALTKPK